ncbi:MAG: PEP-utilizing enzyme [Candidatus ainarchaeum sp.]|nr:PEP-utilizing enzyme [Candidatus ainarchaeum sp.]
MKEILRGITAQKGKTVGIARVVSENNLSGKFENGDVLVAEFTSPVFVPLIKKASAIITDSGGILCHAAIIAREIGIPCIVGTRTATKQIKDGQKIVVDANRGLVYEI